MTDTVVAVKDRILQLMSTGAIAAKMPPAVATSTAPTPDEYAASASVMAEQPNAEVAAQAAVAQKPTVPPAALYMIGAVVVLYLLSKRRT